MLELVILGLLKEGPLHGYDLRKRIRENFRPLSNLSFGSLYPALGRLEASGAVRSTTPQPERPSQQVDSLGPFTGSLSGERAATVARRATKAALALGGHSTRARKVYEITPQGERAFEELLESSERQDPDLRSFSLRLAFARHLSPSSRLRLLERRRLEIADRLEQSRATLASSCPRDRFARSIATHTCDVLALDLAWVESLLAEERLEATTTNATNAHGTARGLTQKGTN